MNKEVIDKSFWHVCKICNKSMSELAKIYGGSGKYYTDVFKKHLVLDHNISVDIYFLEYLEQEICCSSCNKPCIITRRRKSDFAWKNMCGRNDGILRWAEEAKISRSGEGNPMYGKDSWNKNLSKETDDRVRLVAEKRIGQKTSEETRKIQSLSAKKRSVHGHTGKKHTEETKIKLRENTLKMIKDGKFKKIRTEPFLKVKNILEELGVTFEEEKTVSYWSFDFYVPSADLYIEVDGDYFHSNPNTRWPNGPQTITQKKVWANDIKKNKYCLKNNIKLIRIWENDINKNIDDVKELISCHLTK
jgi:very-short-patch-repair endonuclease